MLFASGIVCFALGHPVPGVCTVPGTGFKDENSAVCGVYILVRNIDC